MRCRRATTKASLIQTGVELARTTLDHGGFRLKAPSERVEQAKDLQIDIIQSGRHIGTFLLKKQDSSGHYLSAVHLSEELKGLDFKRLTVPLRGKAGLLAKAERIIMKAVSAKKDWSAFSEELNSFRHDFFWSSRESWYDAYPLLLRLLRKAAESAGTDSGKPVLNFIAAIDELLAAETDRKLLEGAARAWLAELHASSIDMASSVRPFATVLSSLHNLFPDADLRPGLARLLYSARQKLVSMPIAPGRLLDSVRKFAQPESAGLEQYGEKSRSRLLHSLSQAAAALDREAIDEVFSFLSGLDPGLFESERMIVLFQEAASGRVNPDSAGEFTAALLELVRFFPGLSPRALETMRSLVSEVLSALASIDRPDLCRRLLETLAQDGAAGNDLLMTPAVAQAVLHAGNHSLVGAYAAMLTHVTIPAPGITGLSSENWAEKVNPLHLDRLTKFLDLIQIGDDQLQEVLLHVIANLSVTGVFIPDDRIFQRRISAYLNSPAMHAPFLLTFLLLAKLPVYFHEVGAVSALRDLSTEIDSWGNDPVLYFLRKQVHVNASNYNIRLIEKIIASWVFNDLSLVRDAVPPDVYENRKPELVARYSPAVVTFFRSHGVLDEKGALHFRKILELPDAELRSVVREGQLDEVPSKIMLLCRLYREVVRKYSFDPVGSNERDGAAEITNAVNTVNTMRSAERVFRSAEKTEAREDLYFKRHIAFGIPSVLGTYHEPKFDALVRFLQQGSFVRKHLEESALALASRGPHAPLDDIRSRLRVLAVCRDMLAVHGLENMQIEEFETIIEHGELQLSQAVDLLRMWQKEIAWMVRFFNTAFHAPLTALLGILPEEDLPGHLRGLDREDRDFTNKAADIVIRDLMAAVPGLMETDRIIERLLSLLTVRAGLADDRISTDPVKDQKVCFDMTLIDKDVMRFAPLIGGKAKNLAYLQNRGFRVPPAAFLSSRLTDSKLRSTHMIPALREAVRTIEQRTGSAFGDPDKPLFLAVRSASYVSMPGILSTVLYCGMNAETLRGFIRATGDARLAYDSFRRFLEQYSVTVSGLDPSVLDLIRTGLMRERGLEELEQLRARDLEDLVARYERGLSIRGRTIPGDVWEQLARTADCIYASWFAERAEQFRRATKTSAHWGTAVVLMEMVFANAAGAGSSVFFTRNPLTLEPGVYGETRSCATGEDLVHGRRRNMAISRSQTGARPTGNAAAGPITSLEEADPGLFRLHQDLAIRVELALGSLPQEVEAAYTRTREGTPVLYVLQSRRMEFHAGKPARFEDICSMESRVVGRGIGAHGGAVSGVVTFTHDREETERLGRKSGMPVILLRTTANTDDVSVMPAISGIITSSGGVPPMRPYLPRSSA